MLTLLSLTLVALVRLHVRGCFRFGVGQIHCADVGVQCAPCGVDALVNSTLIGPHSHGTRTSFKTLYAAAFGSHVHVRKDCFGLRNRNRRYALLELSMCDCNDSGRLLWSSARLDIEILVFESGYVLEVEQS